MLATVEPPLSIARRQWLDMRGVADAGDSVYEHALGRLQHALTELDLDFEGVRSPA